MDHERISALTSAIKDAGREDHARVVAVDGLGKFAVDLVSLRVTAGTSVEADALVTAINAALAPVFADLVAKAKAELADLLK